MQWNILIFFYLVILYGFKIITYLKFYGRSVWLPSITCSSFAVDYFGSLEVHWFVWVPLSGHHRGPLGLSMNPFKICLNNSLKLSYFHPFSVVMATGYIAAILKHHGKKLGIRWKITHVEKKLKVVFNWYYNYMHK